MSDENGHGGEAHLAPVTDLFARRTVDHRPPRDAGGAQGDADADPRGAAPADGATTSPSQASRGEEQSSPRGFVDGEPVGGWQLDATVDVDPDGWWVPPAAADGAWSDLSGESSHDREPKHELPTRPNTAAADDGNVVSMFRSRPDAHTEIASTQPRSETPDDVPADDRPSRTRGALPPVIRASDLVPVSASATEGAANDRVRRARRPAETDEKAPATPQGRGPAASAPRLRVVTSSAPADDAGDELTADEQFEHAERALLKKLRGKGLSVNEARTFLRGLDTPRDVIDSVVDVFLDRRYLDDAVLAEQLVHVALTRKSQGRRAIALALSARGIERSVVDDALADIDDDDDERALEFARSKARSMTSLDRDVALRRLLGQLARRGFAGSAAMSAAKTALDEVSGVRFR